MTFTLPNLESRDVIDSWVSNATMELKLKDTPGDPSDNSSCPFRSVVVPSVTWLIDPPAGAESTEGSHEGSEGGKAWTFTERDDDAARKFQLWQGDHVKVSPWREVFVPSTNGDSIPRQVWLQIRKGRNDPDMAMLSRYEADDDEATIMRDTISAMKNSKRTGEWPSFGTDSPPIFHGANVTSGCSTLIPDNSQADRSAKGPVFLLPNGVEWLDSDGTYHGPVRCFTSTQL
ncbi:hypothetical protein I302_107333 [Kwoniella bestiolae CBS 10118]|uniref:Uncharacterized protein n=1 Tax=Kwoniella bestiolae CBS 10118 TaxID=1296100 RepID=A0A1B9FYV4_9TREE|nr:hypothetical protein I302_06931 [Kwoniella bestiolae CBS 10118]OCF23945.1 hypothetical protein I302_06931 [Kwoniella bestiolae CBS 10118]